MSNNRLLRQIETLSARQQLLKNNTVRKKLLDEVTTVITNATKEREDMHKYVLLPGDFGQYMADCQNCYTTMIANLQQHLEKYILLPNVNLKAKEETNQRASVPQNYAIQLAARVERERLRLIE